jgi:hypothetical protein
MIPRLALTYFLPPWPSLVTQKMKLRRDDGPSQVRIAGLFYADITAQANNTDLMSIIGAHPRTRCLFRS